MIYLIIYANLSWCYEVVKTAQREKSQVLLDMTWKVPLDLVNKRMHLSLMEMCAYYTYDVRL